MLPAVKTRLEEQVPELAGRVGLAVDFQRLLSTGKAPSGGLNAWVLPGTVQGRPGDSATGVFTQPLIRSASVVTMLQSTDPSGARALERLDDFLMDVARAIAGWTPDETTPGVFELAQERPLQAPRGLMGFMTDFRINDRLRIDT